MNHDANEPPAAAASAPPPPVAVAMPPPSHDDPSAVAREDDFEALDPRARLGMRLLATAVLALPYLPASSVLLAVWDADGLGGLGKFGLFLAGLVGLVLTGWWLGGLRYSHTRFRLDATGLRIRRGIYWRSETLVPRSRVQHTDLRHGPLDRRLGLAGLQVYTAGSSLASVGLNGLPEARALALRDALVSDDDDAV